MKAFAKAFYESAAWRRTRAYILKRDAGLCVRCGAPGCIVHHKTELTPRNIDDPMITLNEDNLETVCRTLHIEPDALSAIVATGYGRNNIPFATRTKTEITCHARGAHARIVLVLFIDLCYNNSKFEIRKRRFR